MKKNFYRQFTFYTTVYIFVSFFYYACKNNNTTLQTKAEEKQKNGTDTNQTDPNNPSSLPIAVEDPNIPVTGLARFTLVGRFDTREPARIRFTFSNSKVAFTVKETSRVTIQATSTGTDYIKINIDGQDIEIVPIVASPQPRPYIIAQNLSKEQHTIAFTKMTEPLQYSQQIGDANRTGVITLTDVILDTGGVFTKPPVAKAKTIQFIGDSAYTGYGVLDVRPINSNETCVYTPDTQDATESVPFYTAKFLDMEVHSLSSSGKGLFESELSPDPNQMLVSIYQQTLPYSLTPVWDSKLDKDISVVVIGGGSNDLKGNPGEGVFTNSDKFVTNYVDFIQKIRANSPNALIVCVLSTGAYGSDRKLLIEHIGRAVNAVKSAGDNKVFFFDVWENTKYENYQAAVRSLQLDLGCQYHYGPKGAQYVANRLADFIKPRLPQ
jgi:hypothetical protein